MEGTKKRVVIPLSSRPVDCIVFAFYFINLTIITYIVDAETLIIDNPNNFTYPVWPPKWWVDTIHNYGRTIDPVLIARPVWWKATIWWDVLFFGPYYVVAMYCFLKGKEWIRIPTIVQSSVLITIVTIILAEEIWGAVPAHNLPLVLA